MATSSPATEPTRPPSTSDHPTGDLAPSAPATDRTTAQRLHTPHHLAEQAAGTILAAVARATGGPADSLDVAVVLGSGWKQAADHLGTVVVDIPAPEVPGFRPAAVAGHAGRVKVVRTGAGTDVLLLAARTHLYEGHGVDAVAHGVRAAAAAGCRAVVLTNGAGSTVREWGPGTVVLLRDHVNLTGQTPLRGASFVDMTEAYSAQLRTVARDVAPELPEGVYAQFHGPQFETPAEVAMARLLGADLVGMSTALETIAARAEGMQVLAMSLVTNLAAGTTGQPLHHEEVLEAGEAAAERCGVLLARVVSAVATRASASTPGG